MSNFSIKDRIKSFGYAVRGIALVFRHEHNAWIHLFATLVALSLGFALGISNIEWCIIIICIASVISAEIMNTAVERIADFVHIEQHDKIRDIKDLAAGAVLIFSIGAAICGMIIFLPKMI